jgi:hypothetical protein
MDEEGVIRFKNRQNYSSTPVWFFNETNIIDIQTSKQDDIVNVVEIKANVREVQANQKFWELQSAVRVPANSTLTLWADFEDPVTTVDDPEYITTLQQRRYSQPTRLKTVQATAVSTNFTLSDSTMFSKSYQMEFTNTNGFDVYHHDT